MPGIALAGILRENPLDDPDLAYLTIVTTLLPAGVRGLILCGLFASLMSSLDSIYNYVSTLWSVDIYKRYLKPDASQRQVVRTPCVVYHPDSSRPRGSSGTRAMSR